jgi:phosphoenolpyruvate synthase/pyruvate phosphate dikinase
MAMVIPVYTLDFSEISIKDVPTVGGKNASLGQLFNELRPLGVNVLDSFATTAAAYRRLLEEQGLALKLKAILSDFYVEDVDELANRGQRARSAVLETPLPDELREAILIAYDRLKGAARDANPNLRSAHRQSRHASLLCLLTVPSTIARVSATTIFRKYKIQRRAAPVISKNTCDGAQVNSDD